MSEEQARDIILDSIADGVFTVDETWRITSFNKAAEKITGVRRDEAMGKPAVMFLEPISAKANVL